MLSDVSSLIPALRTWLCTVAVLALAAAFIPLLVAAAELGAASQTSFTQPGGGASQSSQTDPQQAPDPQLAELKNKAERLKAEAEIAESQREIAKAQRERVESSLPSSETKPLEGKLTVDDKATLDIQVLAYAQANKLAREIAKHVAQSARDWKTLVVFDQRSLATLAAYRVLRPQLESLEKIYDKNLPPTVAAAPLLLLAPDIADAVLKSSAGIAALFHSDVDIRGVPTTVGRAGVVAELADALHGEEPTLRVIYPPLDFPLDLLADPASPSFLLETLRKVNESRFRAMAYVRKYDAETAEERKGDPLRDKIELLRTLDEQTDKLMQSLTAVDEKSGTSPLVAALLAEQVATMIGPAKGDSGILYLEVLASGGAHKLVHSLWRGSRLFENGGVVLTYLLVDGSGSIVRSGTLASESGYQKR